MGFFPLASLSLIARRLAGNVKPLSCCYPRTLAGGGTPPTGPFDNFLARLISQMCRNVRKEGYRPF